MLKFLMLSSVNTNFGYYFSNQVNLQEIFSTGTVCTLKASTGITCQLICEKRGMRLWMAKWGFSVHTDDTQAKPNIKSIHFVTSMLTCLQCEGKLLSLELFLRLSYIPVPFTNFVLFFLLCTVLEWQ